MRTGDGTTRRGAEAPLLLGLESELRWLRGPGWRLCSAGRRLRCGRSGSRRGRRRGRRRRGSRGRRGAAGARGGGVEALDDVGGDIERRIAPDDSGIVAAEENLQPALGHDLLDHGEEPALKAVLQVLLELLDFFLCILCEALDLL